MVKRDNESEIIMNDCISSTLKFAPHGEGGEKFKARQKKNMAVHKEAPSDAIPSVSRPTPISNLSSSESLPNVQDSDSD